MVETTKNENTTLITPKERKGSYLDRGFPTGKALLVILGVVFFLQGISAWKIINLEREKASFEAERQNFHFLKQQLPDLQKTTSDLEAKRLELQGEVETLEKRKTMILGDLKQFEQKANGLKSDNEFNETRLKNTDILLAERKAKCDELQAQQTKFNGEVSSLEDKIKERNFELNTLQERVKKLEVEKNDIVVKIQSLEIEKAVLEKLNKDFSSVINNLNSGYTEFTQYQKAVKSSLESATNVLENTTSEIKQQVTNLKNSTDGINQKQRVMAEIQNKFETAITKVENSAEGLSAGKLNIAAQTLEDATKNMRNSVTNLDQEVTNLTRSSIDLKNGVDQSTNNLKASVDQLSNVSTQSGKLLEGIVKELDSFQQKQVAIVEIQNRFATTLKQIESSAENFTSDKLGLQETYRKLKGEASDAIKKIEEIRDVNLKLQKEFDGLRKTVNTLPRDEGVKATKQ